MKSRLLRRGTVMQAAAGPHELPDDHYDDDSASDSSWGDATIYPDDEYEGIHPVRMSSFHPILPLDTELWKIGLRSGRRSFELHLEGMGQ